MLISIKLISNKSCKNMDTFQWSSLCTILDFIFWKQLCNNILQVICFCCLTVLVFKTRSNARVHGTLVWCEYKQASRILSLCQFFSVLVQRRAVPSLARLLYHLTANLYCSNTIWECCTAACCGPLSIMYYCSPVIGQKVKARLRRVG